MTWTLVAVGALGVAASALAVVVGVLIGLADRERPRADPLTFFALFWIGVGVAGFADSVTALAFAVASPGLALAVAALHVRVVFGMLSSFAIAYYLIYIFSGSRRALIPLGVGYGVAFVFVQYVLALRAPLGVHAVTWGVALEFPDGGARFAPIVATLLIVPPLLATIAYASLLRVVEGSAQRARIVAISFALLVILAGSFLRVSDPSQAGWIVVQRLASVAATLLVLAFVRPPAWLAARWPLQPLGASTQPPATNALPVVTTERPQLAP
ncbi:MAG: hypothetical protein ACYDCK_06875 [Thermoplasmatota archaeon]